MRSNDEDGVAQAFSFLCCSRGGWVWLLLLALLCKQRPCFRKSECCATRHCIANRMSEQVQVKMGERSCCACRSLRWLAIDDLHGL